MKPPRKPEALVPAGVVYVPSTLRAATKVLESVLRREIRAGKRELREAPMGTWPHVTRKAVELWCADTGMVSRAGRLALKRAGLGVREWYDCLPVRTRRGQLVLWFNLHARAVTTTKKGRQASALPARRAIGSRVQGW